MNFVGSVVERMGFEPTEAFASLDFESSTISQLGHLSAMMEALTLHRWGLLVLDAQKAHLMVGRFRHSESAAPAGRRDYFNSGTHTFDSLGHGFYKSSAVLLLVTTQAE